MATPPSSRPMETVLVVDDDEEVLSLATDILTEAGYTVIGTSDPRHALRIARTHPEPIHLLVTDIVMPLMNGMQLSTEVQALRPDVKIILISAYRTKEIEDYRMRLGLRGLFLDKPFTIAALTAAARALLVEPAPSPWRRPR